LIFKIRLYPQHLQKQKQAFIDYLGIENNVMLVKAN